MATLTEGNHTGEFLLSEANGERSREKWTITLGSTAMPSGTVLGKVTADGTIVPYDNADSPAGVGVAIGILYDALPAGSGTVKAGVIVRDAEVASARLTGIDATGITDLAALGIIVR